MTVSQHLKSAASLVVISLNLAFFITLALPTSVVRLVVPPLAPVAHRALDAIYRAAVAVDDFWLRRVMGIRWTSPSLDLDPKRPCVVLSNHVSWADIFLIQSLLVSHGLVVKFLTKRELLALPIVGLVLWAFDFPLLRRSSRRGEDDEARSRLDFEALRDACRSARANPVALVSFAEGTRATASRRATRGSPYHHLLPPRVGGFAALCDGLGDAMSGVVDCTLVYPSEAAEATFWRFLSGGLRELEIHAERIAPAEIPTARDDRARWLEARWASKDERIARSLREGGRRP